MANKRKPPHLVKKAPARVRNPKEAPEIQPTTREVVLPESQTSTVAMTQAESTIATSTAWPKPPIPTGDALNAAGQTRYSRKRGWVIAAITASGIFVLAVGYLAYINTPEPAPVPVVMVTATATPTPTDTATPTPTDTGTPLPTPTVVATPSPHHHRHHHYTALLICTGGTPSGPDQCTGK